MIPATISAAYYRGGKSFEVQKKPLLPPKIGEVAVKIAYCGICGTDMHVFHGNMNKRVGFNRIIGHEMSGVVTANGDENSGLAPGKKVVVRPLVHCGSCPACDAGYEHICHNLKFLGLDTDGALQEIWNVPAYTLHELPDSIRLDHAALIEPVAVACHDVRLSQLRDGEHAVVIGGGPIGLLVAIAAREAGGNVVVSEVNPHRLEVARSLGFDAVNPAECDLASEINDRTDGSGAEVVFEVSGTQSGVDAMTSVAAARGRIVMVAIHAKKPQIDLFQFFWRELRLIGARVYEPEDYAKAIELTANGSDAAERLVTDIVPLADVQSAFEALDSEPTAMKCLVKVGIE